MSLDPSRVGDLDYSAHDLRRMDEDTARSTLTVDQYERWEQVQALYEEVADTEAAWDEQADTVADVTVRADMEQLGTRVDVFGNDLLVHADTEDPDFRDAVERLDDEFGDVDGEELGGVDDARMDDLASHLLAMLDHVIVKWADIPWADLGDAQRQSILADARERWGVDGLMLAWADISVAIREDREDKVGQIEKFRDPKRRGDR